MKIETRIIHDAMYKIKKEAEKTEEYDQYWAGGLKEAYEIILKEIERALEKEREE